MRRDSAYLEDIRVAADDIASFIEGMTLKSFAENATIRAAVERKLTIMGEAANRVSASVKEKHPRDLWVRIVQLRNFYIHGYDKLSSKDVWGAAKRLAPRVGRMVASLIPVDNEEAP